MLSKNPSTVTVFVISQPYSTDPIDYDAFVHHITFRSVYASLITQYKLGSYTGVLAHSWRSDDNYKTWTFELREKYFFENGDAIDGRAVADSMLRLAFLMKSRKSSSEVFDNLIGIESLASPRSEIAGLTYTKGSITFKFRKPMPKVLDTLSFGLYGVVHKSNFDQNSGAWLDQKKVISSGPYKVASWDELGLNLERRKAFLNDVGHPRQFQRIEFKWDPVYRETADLVMGDSIETSLQKSYQFFGGANSSIAYVKCRSWKLKSSPCSNLQYRKTLRNEFYRQMEKLGITVTRSFFPLAIKSVKEFQPDATSTLPSTNYTLKVALSKTRNPVFQAFNEAIKLASKQLGIDPAVVEVPRATWMKEYDQNLSTYTADLYMLSTGILLEEPMQDIRFMFFSEEGIRLPDSNGRIKTELKNENPDIQFVNQELWEQAIVWPISHYASGFWARPNVDFSLINLLLPPTDFQWLGEAD